MFNWIKNILKLFQKKEHPNPKKPWGLQNEVTYVFGKTYKTGLPFFYELLYSLPKTKALKNYSKSSERYTFEDGSTYQYKVACDQNIRGTRYTDVYIQRGVGKEFIPHILAGLELRPDGTEPTIKYFD